VSWPEVPLTEGWRLDGPGADAVPAAVPGTVAGALRAAGLPLPDDLDEHDWAFSCEVATPANGPVVLRLDGLATLAEVELNGEVVLTSGSMWAAHAVDVTSQLRPAGTPNALVLRFAALGPEVRRPRRPRARWRTKLVANGLRWHRTMLLGRAPGIAPQPAAVGPWRPVALELRGGPGVTALTLRARLAADAGVLTVDAAVAGVAPTAVDVVLDGPSGTHRAALDAGGRAELRVPDVARWWPHTHGEPVLHDVRLVAGDEELAHRRVGFRTLGAGAHADHDVERDGLDLHVNAVRIFARGAVWTPPDLVGLTPREDELRATLTAARDAGMNLIRVVGIAAYETPAFHDLCDELGLFVWQDAMFANLDYPLADEDFRATVEAELAALVGALAGRPSTAVLCGGSEVGQQVAMLGLDPMLAREGVGYALLPAAAATGGCDAVVVPDAPSGGARPFRTDAGVANYFGVGGYRRDLGDVRRAGVRFASECLAIANVPGEARVAAAGPAGGVPRDAGADWDFADVRDHYLQALFDVEPAALREADVERYLELSRAVSGELMAEVLGEWRRAGSPCGGAIVLWLRDLLPGAGWGVLDDRGGAKVAWHHLRRALAPTAVWTTDEGLNGIAVHVANDGPEPLRCDLRVALLGGAEHLVADGRTALEVPPHTTVERDLEEVLGHFADAAYAYRFGPPAHDVVLAALERDGAVLAQALRFPAGRPVTPQPADALGARAWIEGGGVAPRLVIESRVLLYGVRLHLPGWRADDDAFHVVPGERRELPLTPVAADAVPPAGELSALNLDGRLPVIR
jgi:beta-mannosidase